MFNVVIVCKRKQGAVQENQHPEWVVRRATSRSSRSTTECRLGRSVVPESCRKRARPRRQESIYQQASVPHRPPRSWVWRGVLSSTREPARWWCAPAPARPPPSLRRSLVRNGKSRQRSSCQRRCPQYRYLLCWAPNRCTDVCSRLTLSLQGRDECCERTPKYRAGKLTMLAVFYQELCSKKILIECLRWMNRTSDYFTPIGGK